MLFRHNPKILPRAKKIIYYIFYIPKPIKGPSKFFASIAFLKGFVRFPFDAILHTITFPSQTISQMRWYFISTCFALLWFLHSLELVIAPLLLQYRVIEWLVVGSTCRSIKNFQCHTAFIMASLLEKLGLRKNSRT